MLKRSFIVIMFLCSVIRLFSQDFLFHIIEDTPVWTVRDTSVNPITDSTVTRVLNKGTIISNVSEPFNNIASNIVNGVPSFFYIISFEKNKYYIPANTFTALYMEEAFNKSFLTSADPQAYIWINAYFLDAMRTGSRDILIPYEQRLVDYFEDEYVSWYDSNNNDFAQSLVVTQGTVSIGGLVRDEFWIQQIKRISNGYQVTVTWNTGHGSYDWISEFRSMKVRLPERNEKNRDPISNLYFIFDGDYIDVYYSTDMDDSHRTFCTSLARVDSEIRKQLDGIIRDISYYPDIYVPYNPSKITFWPKRADGRMDYQPPEGAAIVPHVFEEVIQTEPIKLSFENADTENVDTENQGEEISKNSAKTSPMPFWVWFAIVGGAVVIAGGVVVFILKRRK